jgi:hypothetical protein
LERSQSSAEPDQKKPASRGNDPRREYRGIAKVPSRSDMPDPARTIPATPSNQPNTNKSKYIRQSLLRGAAPNQFASIL